MSYLKDMYNSIKEFEEKDIISEVILLGENGNIRRIIIHNEIKKVQE